MSDIAEIRICEEDIPYNDKFPGKRFDRRSMTWTKTILLSMLDVGRNGGKMEPRLSRESVKKLLDHWI